MVTSILSFSHNVPKVFFPKLKSWHCVIKLSWCDLLTFFGQYWSWSARTEHAVWSRLHFVQYGHVFSSVQKRFKMQYDLDSTLFNMDMFFLQSKKGSKCSMIWILHSLIRTCCFWFFFYSTNKDSAFGMIWIPHCSIRTCFCFFFYSTNKDSAFGMIWIPHCSIRTCFFYSTNKDSAFSMISILHYSIRTFFFTVQWFGIQYDLDSTLFNKDIFFFFFFLQYKQRFGIQYDLDSTLFNKDMFFFYSTNKDSAFSMIWILHCLIMTVFFTVQTKIQHSVWSRFYTVQ